MVKSYGHVDALKGVDFSLNRNEVVGLVGDNGAGKSTLIKIMSGVVQPDRGEFFYEGKQVPLRSRRDSEKLGIETIYQDIALVGSMSVMRNIFCGREITDRFGGLRLREMRAIAMDVLEHTVEIAGDHVAGSGGRGTFRGTAAGGGDRARGLFQEQDAAARRAHQRALRFAKRRRFSPTSPSCGRTACHASSSRTISITRFRSATGSSSWRTARS